MNTSKKKLTRAEADFVNKVATNVVNLNIDFNEMQKAFQILMDSNDPATKLLMRRTMFNYLQSPNEVIAEGEPLPEPKEDIRTKSFERKVVLRTFEGQADGDYKITEEVVPNPEAEAKSIEEVVKDNKKTKKKK